MPQVTRISAAFFGVPAIAAEHGREYRDSSRAQVYIVDNCDSAQDAALASVVKAVLNAALLQQIEYVSAEIGEQSGGDYFTGQAMNGVNDASYLITFKPKKERRRSIWEIVDSVYGQTMHAVPGIRPLALKEMGADVMVYGSDRRGLYRLAAAVADEARKIPGLYEVSTSSALSQPEQRIVADRTRAAPIGLTP
ncbi:MAG: hypothetical protein ABI182_07865 [Candidatus Baltobacteraceae bacterium]